MGYHVAEFKVSGTWIKPTGVTSVRLLLVAGGQGGSGGSVTQPNFIGGGGGGGGSAAALDLHDVDQNILITIGAGGAGGTTGGSNGGSTNAIIGIRNIGVTGGAAAGANGSATSGYPHGGGGGGGAGEIALESAHTLGPNLAGRPTGSVSRNQALGRAGYTLGSPNPLITPYVTGGKGRNGFGGGGSAASLPADFAVAQQGNRAFDGGGRGGEWQTGAQAVNGTPGVPNSGAGGGGAVSYGQPGSGGQGGSGYSVISWWGDRGENLTLWSSPAPRRMVKIENDVVVDCIETQALTPWLGLGWRDVTNKAYQGSPVSVGWVWDGLFWMPPPIINPL